MNNSLGLYLHIPFCESKCSYCNFYSYKDDNATLDRYTDTLCEHLKAAGERLNMSADTLYFGGGTPSLLGGDRIAELVVTAREYFGLEDAEIAVECNPADDLCDHFNLMTRAGVNRISLGVQSAVDLELKALSRRHTFEDVKKAVHDAKQAGIHNISLDLMLGIPHQTMDSLLYSLEQLLSLEPTHISSYMLKIESGTPFGKSDIKALCLPDEDAVSDMYLFISEYLSQHGFEHYEISNFAKAGFRSNHNTKYWQCKEYLGLGPSAHSYLSGKRFYFESNTKKYMDFPIVVNDGLGGQFEEYVMLKLRLSDGISLSELSGLYGSVKAKSLFIKAEKLKSSGLIKLDSDRLSLTVQGFLVSNVVIGELLF